QRRTFSVTTEAHMTMEPLGLYFASVDAIGQKDAGGHCVAACFEPVSVREKVALAWVWAWNESAHHSAEKASLASTAEGEEALKQLESAANLSQTTVSRFQRGRKPVTTANKQDWPPSPRTLKAVRNL